MTIYLILLYCWCPVVFLLTLPNGLTGIKQITIKNAVVSASSNLGGIAEAGKLSQEKGNEILPSSNVTGKITFVNASVPPTNQNVETQLKKGNSTVSIENVQLLNSEKHKRDKFYQHDGNSCYWCCT
ncbi:hypothetical protein NQ318_011290 [Aromia moschata]|uniref:Uncharacterized protein n=1 Tax=Aromia moschata TaxID=1265417 RepID=A0AAV8X4L7_9CUCU|nr:hypothetical protein NQ318_011290 [Aromia moschata]